MLKEHFVVSDLRVIMLIKDLQVGFVFLTMYLLEQHMLYGNGGSGKY
jgi:hypothetical protein